MNVEFVHDRHFPGFAVATETETVRKPNTEKKDGVNNIKGHHYSVSSTGLPAALRRRKLIQTETGYM